MFVHGWLVAALILGCLLLLGCGVHYFTRNSYGRRCGSNVPPDDFHGRTAPPLRLHAENEASMDGSEDRVVPLPR